MVLDDRGVVALRPQDVLGAAVEDEDVVRLAEIVEDDSIVRKDLFPDISIGDAPVIDGA